MSEVRTFDIYLVVFLRSFWKQWTMVILWQVHIPHTVEGYGVDLSLLCDYARGDRMLTLKKNCVVLCKNVLVLS